MAEIYPLGENRIFYKTRTEPPPALVEVDLLDPSFKNNVKRPLTKVKDSEQHVILGLYSFLATFLKEGTYIAVFYEDGDEKTSQAFSTRRLPTDSGGFRSFLGDNVINTR